MPSFGLKLVFLLCVGFSLTLGCGTSAQDTTPVQGNSSHNESNTETNDQSNNDGAASSDDSNNDSSDNNSGDEGEAPPPTDNQGSDSDDSNGSDTNEDPFAGRPQGQCVTNADCPQTPNGQICNRTFPGGSCSGCGTDTHCPDDTICNAGTCVTECSDQNECPPGLYCLGSGKCGSSWCVDSACPVELFSCSEGNKCERQACSDTLDCPANTTCIESLCIENRQI